MGLVQSSTTWLRQKLGWSNSRQSWEERLGALALLTGGGCALAWGGRLSAVQQVVVWGLLVLTAAVLLRRGWLKLFGPVLFYDMVRSARRGRFVIVRCAYAGLLLFFLCCAWFNMRPSGLGNDRHEAARLAEAFFETFMAVQILAVGVLTPAYVAGAIAEEKDRKTLEFLLATDLRNREIVLSKLLARLANLTLFVLTGLPILSMIQFLGGVDPNLVLAGCAVTALTMAGLGALSILNSTYFKKPRDAIALTYLGMVAYLTTSFLLLLWQASSPGAMSTAVWFGFSPLTLGDLVNAFNAGNLLLVLGKLGDAGARGTLATDVPALLWQYAWFHGTVAVGLTVWSVARLRAVALKQAQGEKRRGLRALRLWKRPPVSSPPMVWKEVFVEGGVRFNWLGWIVLALLLVATLLPGFLIVAAHLDELWGVLAGVKFQGSGPLGDVMNAYVRIAGTLVACLTLLGVAVRASSSLSGERDRQTLDALLTSPLDSDAILFAKWLGAILSVRWAWLWLGVIWGLGLITGGLHLIALPLLAGAWFVFAAFLATLGLWWSVAARTTLRATVGTLIATALVAVGHWLPWMCCGPFLFMSGGRGPEILLKLQMAMTPPAVLGLLAFHRDEFPRGFEEWAGYAVIGLFLWVVMTLALGVALSSRFCRVAVRGPRRHPERFEQVLRAIPVAAPVAPAPPSLPASLQGAILVAETWEKPANVPPGEQAPPSGGRQPPE